MDSFVNFCVVTFLSEYFYSKMLPFLMSRRINVNHNWHKNNHGWKNVEKIISHRHPFKHSVSQFLINSFYRQFLRHHVWMQYTLTSHKDQKSLCTFKEANLRKEITKKLTLHVCLKISLCMYCKGESNLSYVREAAKKGLPLRKNNFFSNCFFNLLKKFRLPLRSMGEGGVRSQ